MENNTATQTFAETLRTATADAHAELEDLQISKSIISPDVTRGQYTTYLSLMHDVVKDTEENIIPIIADVVTDYAGRKKTHLIEDDLQYLGAAKANYTTPLSTGREINPAFAMGIYYVVEGSTLGGRVILKNIKPALGLDENGGAKYFTGYGAVTGSTWRAFIMLMEEYAAKGNNADEIIAGANHAFRAIKQHLQQNTPQ